MLALKRIDKKNRFFHAPKNTQYIAAITSQSRKEGVMHLFFFDKNDKLIDKGMKFTHFNPKIQTWYKKAKKSNKMIFTAPYLLDHPKKIGVTFAKKMGQNVFGVDMMLQNFDSYLASLASDKIQMLLYSQKADMIYASSIKMNLKKPSKELREVLKQKEFDELSESQYEMAHEIRAYQKSQEELLNSIIQLIAEAIDVKSLYTGEHCKRVPEIAKMLLDRANEDETIFKDFHFEGADNYRAFEIGSWLHDCGKLTTLEYVMDKSTKLETIYNRIHEIRTRFEVLLRDAKIHEYEVLLAGGEREKANVAYEATKKELMEEFTLVAKLNIGSEFMDAAEKEQIEKIASREWVRNFDYEAYKQEGFKLEVPEYQYNLGEVYNLCIERGTLNAEERYKIQEHVIMTIKMLEQIPFPKELQNVPKYAGTHHETLIGTGYPRKLTKEELSIPERIMAVADIFEALTASDRVEKLIEEIS